MSSEEDKFVDDLIEMSATMDNIIESDVEPENKMVCGHHKKFYYFYPGMHHKHRCQVCDGHVILLNRQIDNKIKHCINRLVDHVLKRQFINALSLSMELNKILLTEYSKLMKELK